MQDSAKVILYVFSKILSPEQIDEILGLHCDRKYAIGDIRVPNTRVRCDTNIWLIEQKVTGNDTIEDALLSLLKRLQGKSQQCRELLKNCDLQCAIVIHARRPPELAFQCSTLEQLAEYCFELDIDQYYNPGRAS